MENTTNLILSTSCLLSLLAFIPAPIEFAFSQALQSNDVYTTFLCAAVASFPMFLDCLWDVSCKLKWIRMESSRDHSYLVERLLIFIGFIFPTVGFFASRAANPSQVGMYYTACSTLQSIWMGGAYLAILHSSKSSIWTLQWCLCILLCLVGSNVSTLFFSVGLAMEVLYFLFIAAAAIIFIYLYGTTITSVQKKAGTDMNTNPMSSADYFCLMYATLTLFNFIVQLVVTSIMYNVYGDEIAIIYTNIAAIVCITLANMIPNRREEEAKLKLESTEQSLAMKQAFVRYLSHEMRTAINVALVGLMMHEQYLAEKDLLSMECKDTLTDVKGAVEVALETLNEALNYEKLQSKVMTLDKAKEDPLAFVLSSTSMLKASALSAGISLILPEATEVSWLENYWIDIDIRKMSQVMRNLMSNALKFTPAGGSVTVSMKSVEQLLTSKNSFLSQIDSLLAGRQRTTSTSEPWLEISVRDEGVGIEQEYLQRIFNEVLQINPNKNQGGKVTEMGLYISKGITELHGGMVGVHSAGRGQGSCFKVLLPLHREKIVSTSSVNASLIPRISAAQVSPFNDVDNNEKCDNDNKIPAEDLYSRVRLHSSVPSEQRDRVTRIGESTGSSIVVSGDLHVDCIEDNSPSLIYSDTSRPIDEALTPPITLYQNEESQARLIASSTWTNDQLRGQRVLMVDDSPTNLKMCVKLLEKLGAEVEKAEDGRIAVEMVQQALLREQASQDSSQHRRHQSPLQSDPFLHRMYDFVLMDNQMPHMTGAQACKMMGFTGIIIGLTGNVFEQEIVDYIAEGANAVLSKPLVLANLFETLRQISAANKV